MRFRLGPVFILALCAASFVLGFMVNAARNATTAPPAASATADKMLREWARAWSSHNVEQVLALYTDDCVYEDVALGFVKNGKQEMRALLEDTFRRTPDVRVELHSSVVSGNRAALEWLMTAGSGTEDETQTSGDGAVILRGTTLLELRGGKISRARDYWDTATVTRQTGGDDPMTYL